MRPHVCPRQSLLQVYTWRSRHLKTTSLQDVLIEFLQGGWVRLCGHRSVLVSHYPRYTCGAADTSQNLLSTPPDRTSCKVDGWDHAATGLSPSVTTLGMHVAQQTPRKTSSENLLKELSARWMGAFMRPQVCPRQSLPQAYMMHSK
jgi:hypothetical protein